MRLHGHKRGLFLASFSCVVRAPFWAIMKCSLKFSKSARVGARLPTVLFSLGRFRMAFRVFIVSFKETVSLGSLIQPVLQFSHVEERLLMLAEGRTLEYSLLFFLESL
jgi:hypothetical protein